VFHFTITVKSTIASTDAIACIAGVSTEDLGTVNGIVDGAGTAVTRGTGTTVTCTVTVPYSWKLATASTDRVNLSYSVILPVNFTATTGYPKRQGTQSLGTIAVPVSGTTTTEAIAATI
jgi:hypothetical protein